jgi:hypothetical protein
MLPAFDLPQFDIVWLLLGTLTLVLVVPRWGVALHALTLVWAILLDQMRLQPEFISLVVLMAGTLDSPAMRLIARAHLIALWFFSGFHKLISPGYYDGVVPFFAGYAKDAMPVGWQIVGAIAPLFEMALAVMAVIPRTRRLCAVCAAPFHIWLLMWLVFRLEWNEAVCPWNGAVAVAAFALIWPWRETFAVDLRNATRLIKGVVAFILLSPLLFYVGLLDPFLAYCVYTNNCPEALVLKADRPPNYISAVPDPRINVAMPAEHRLFEAYFDQIAEAGDKLIIEDSRWVAKLFGWSRREIVKR